MASPPGTPDARRDGLNYEFTPIGYTEGKASSRSTPNTASKKRPPHDESILSQEDGHGSGPKRARKLDDTLNSTRIFNDSSFEDTLPSQIGIPNLPNTDGKTVLDSVERDGESGGASNPLKEQQDSLYKLNLENYNLRVKCNSLLKFLNNVTDEGELKKNLDIISELQEWKTKYQKLASSYRDLQLKFDQIDRNDPDRHQKETALHNEKLRDLETKLKEYRHSANKSRDVIAQLEKNLTTSTQQSRTLNEHLETQTQSQRQAIETLKSKISQNYRLIEEREASIEELNSKLGGEVKARESLETQTKVYAQRIEELEKQLHEYEIKIQDIQQSLEKARKDLGAASGRRSSREEIHTPEKVRVQTEIDQTLAKNRELRAQMAKLKANSNVFESDINSRDMKIKALESEIRNLHEQFSSQGMVIEEGKARYERLKSLSAELQKALLEKDEIKRDNDRLRQQIVSQATRSPGLKENARKAQESKIQAEKLKIKIKNLERDLDSANKEAEILRHEHKVEMENIRTQLGNSDMEPLLAKHKLEKEVSILKLELESLRETKDREISLLENRYELLKQENKQLNQQREAHTGQSQKKLSERQAEIDELAQRCSDLTMEKVKLNKELGQSQESQAEMKKELARVTARLEYVTKEFIKYRELYGSKAPDSETSRFNEKWAEKFRSMKQKLLHELKSLQEENLALEKRLLENQQRPPRSASPDLRKLSLQDQVDYYKLRYHREVEHNNDLKVMNEYLNRVLRASSRHVRLDIMKLENEALTDLWPEYPYRGHLRFKTVALMVLAMVRVQRASTKKRWDAQRITYLRQKIALDQDRVTW
ncbi:LADA_0B02982g1_1 [Lachancea dasiensis]|uniref:Spindle pole body component 110 n=1 Tax=Lachancea dasiensis TaxID=1072105 RepID=A0A1G4ISZ9_9SACH|nr:LADA_0B02982g1_1 [Lachancea dasiensis]